MTALNVQVCPETGICSIIRADGKKIDLMPDEVSAVRAAAGNAAGVKEALAGVDADFAGTLGADEIAQVARRLRKP
jgi:hypothetical protein